jgi:regulator of protease activity HflC (stomatin/prohibitin superfamily)
MFAIWLAIVLLAAATVLVKSVKIIGQAEVMVVERLGRFHRVARSGLNLLIPFIERPRTLNVRYFESDVRIDGAHRSA